MRILSIESSGNHFSIVLMEDDKILHEYVNETPFSASKMLAPVVDELLSEHKITTRDIDVALYNCGPGSFTGLRVALSFLKGLFFDQQEKIIAIPSFDILNHGNSENRIPIFEAKRDEVYIYSQNEINHIKKTKMADHFDESTKFISYGQIQPEDIFNKYNTLHKPYHAKNLVLYFLDKNKTDTYLGSENELIYVYD